MKKIHRFIGSWQLGPGNVRIDDAKLSHQLQRVLKLATGEQIVLGTGTGIEATCHILGYQDDAVIVNVVTITDNPNEPNGTTILYCSVLKSEHFELAAAKATEVGIKEIVPLVTARTVKFGMKHDRLAKIVRESAELVGRGVVPCVHEPMAFDAALTHAHTNDVNFFFDPSGKTWDGVKRGNKSIGLWIGPEGGWDPSELEAAREYGLRIISLGPLVMRAETAAVVVSYLASSALQT